MKEWKFDRYRDGKLMAQGVRVHAATEEEARRKARALFDYEQCTFKLRSNVLREQDRKAGK